MHFPNSYCKQTQEQVDAVVAQAAKDGHRLAVAVTDGSGFAVNALRWSPTAEGLEKAYAYAGDLFSRWMSAKEYRIEGHAPREHDSLRD